VHLAGAPVPIAWWIGRKIARSTAALAVLVAELALVLASGLWLYWEAFLGPTSGMESLAGLVVLFGPLYQLPGLLVTVFAAWVVGRRTKQPAS